MTVRCTQRLLKAIGVPPGELADVPASADDWYANLLWFDRRKCLLIMHASTLFPLFVSNVSAADLRGLGELVERNAQRALYEKRFRQTPSAASITPFCGSPERRAAASSA